MHIAPFFCRNKYIEIVEAFERREQLKGLQEQKRQRQMEQKERDLEDLEQKLRTISKSPFRTVPARHASCRVLCV